METLLFPLKEIKSYEESIFEQTEFGRIHAVIPFQELAAPFKQYIPGKSRGGRPSHLSVEGALALMFLKHYLNCSDRQLLDRLNGDVFVQLFCFTRIPLHQPIRDYDLIRRWRSFFGKHMDLDSFQNTLGKHWKGQLSNSSRLMDDATCYESNIKYPTDVKLLVDCCKWLYTEVVKASTFYGLPIPKNKYKNLVVRVNKYQRLRKKSRVFEKKLRRSLLYWVNLWEKHLQSLFDMGSAYHEKLPDKVYKRLNVVRQIYAQQDYMYKNNVRRVNHRIVSLNKPYIRPIVRGKERKSVEFGAKVNMSQVDGINFIEHLSFEAFHEGNRVWRSIFKHKRRVGECTEYAADSIYATNKNRTFARRRGIQTSFRPKGPKAKDEKERREKRIKLAKARSTVLEGSFGTEKLHYGLLKVRARTQQTEIAWIIFGVHAANAVRLARRKEATSRRQQTRAA